ncbi:nitroreductase family protein [Homoserinibacter sp. YIM 151385]|uniref:nitroreductase family protein n=1 Tax=Homoserinibacter sp. YIM 151385 TaxID=2985506 RepID=UPI0022F02569|nr:nitroreductase family protein [Homoserinibacter sp. YIM 151385]WBU36953.1 nitroreductase family protein [Homoserinibacter sp. YIM 151385]
MTITTPAAGTRRTSETSVPITPLLDERWSPRSYDETAEIDDATVDSLLEAARWAPSAMNLQPRRFIVGRRGTRTFELILENLMGFNSAWAHRASVLVLSAVELGAGDGSHDQLALYDLGQSVAHLTVQAHDAGLHVHQMSGIDIPGLRAAFDLPEHLVPATVTAVGVVAEASQLEGPAAERETAPRSRKPLSELVLRRD